MHDTVTEPAGRRSTRARLGVTALNLILPGLGLIRIGHWRTAVLFFPVPLGFGALVTFGLGHWPITGYRSAVAALVLAVALLGATYIVPMMLTWRRSSHRAPLHWWSRWYALIVIAVVVLSLLQRVPPLLQHFYKPFYAPSDSMAPTIGRGDKFVVDMRWHGPAMRGDVVVFHAADSVRVDRIAAIAGDRIAMRVR